MRTGWIDKDGIIAAAALLALGGCGSPDGGAPARDPKAVGSVVAGPAMVFAAMPLSGDIAAARAAGFTTCFDGNYGLRCRKDNVTVMGVGPLSAAVDLDAAEKDRPARFDHLTLWKEGDQSAVLELGNVLKRADWQSCLTPDDERYLNPPSPIHVAIDTNYWGIRRVTISAPAPGKARYCP